MQNSTVLSIDVRNASRCCHGDDDNNNNKMTTPCERDGDRGGGDVAIDVITLEEIPDGRMFRQHGFCYYIHTLAHMLQRQRQSPLFGVLGRRFCWPHLLPNEPSSVISEEDMRRINASLESIRHRLIPTGMDGLRARAFALVAKRVCLRWNCDAGEPDMESWRNAFGPLTEYILEDVVVIHSAWKQSRRFIGRAGDIGSRIFMRVTIDTRRGLFTTPRVEHSLSRNPVSDVRWIIVLTRGLKWPSSSLSS